MFRRQIQHLRKDGGRIVINTASVDRDRDRVFPAGARIDDYLKNPVVQWAHDYYSPFATIGRTTKLEVSPEGIVAEFDLRPAANESDPQNIVRLLWEGEWIRTASIGFMPDSTKPNDVGGRDFETWALLEWSLVPVPSNQDALRLAVKGLTGERPDDIWADAALRTITDQSLTNPMRADRLKTIEEWRAKFSSPIPQITLRNNTKSPACRQEGESEDECRSRKISEIMEEDPEMDRDQAVAMASRMCSQMCEEGKGEDGDTPPGRAWVRIVTADAAGIGRQKVIATFHQFTVDVPEDATILQADPINGTCEELPHPEAGKSIQFKRAVFVPPILFEGEFGQDGVYVLEQRFVADTAMFTPLIEADVLGTVELGPVECALSEEDSLPVAKSIHTAVALGGVDILTLRGARAARRSLLKRKRLAAQIKRGRVLSSKNEQNDDAGKDAGPIKDASLASLLDADGERELSDSFRLLVDTVKQSMS